MLCATRKLLFAIFCIIWNLKIHQRLINPGTKLFIKIIIYFNEVIFHLNASRVIIRWPVFLPSPPPPAHNTRYILLSEVTNFSLELSSRGLGDALQELHYAWCKLVSIYRKTRGKLLKAKLQAFPRDGVIARQLWQILIQPRSVSLNAWSTARTKQTSVKSTSWR